MNKKLKTSIKIATAVLASAVVICFATPHIAGSDSKTAHGADFPVKAAVVATLPETTATVTTGTTTTTSFTSTSTTSTIASTSTITSETTTTVVTEDFAAPVETPAEPTEAATQPAEPQREYVVFKPSTHYIHKSTCRWVDSTCYEITDTKEIECRKCSECNPEIEIINNYVESTPVVANNTGITDYERQLLAEITCHEYGSNWVSTAEKAKIVAGVMNRVYSPAYPNDIYSVLMQDGQFHGSWDGGHGYWPGCITPNEDSWAAVDYYFAHQNEFGSWTSWSGDGQWNYFY